MDSNPAPAANNVPEYAVSEISGAIKRTLEQAFGRVRVRGELTEVKRYPSGHIYLSLKDEGGKLAGVIWKSSVRNLSLQPENGVEVIATGKVSAYGDRSSYQLIIERLDYAGEGALLARIEKLRLKLLGEGLFDAARKRPLPMLPQVIGVVTSEKGAVIQDIRTTLLRRFPRRLILWPVAVQGQGAAEQIAAAINGFSALPVGGTVPRPDVVIVARGGGSLEDLMAFNEEIVVRAAAESSIPLISAVGHETDTTLIDFASDQRAPTPTAAAELAVPARADLLADLSQRTARLVQATRGITERAHRRLVQAERRLPDLPNILGALRQRLEDRGERLGIALPALMGRKRRALAEVAPRLPHPREQLAGKRHALALLSARAEAAWRRGLSRRAAQPALGRISAAPVLALLRERKARLEGLAARLEGVSYAATLARGFVLVQDSSGAPVTTAAGVGPGAALALHFADGQVAVTAEGTKPARRKPRAPGEQGALL